MVCIAVGSIDMGCFSHLSCFARLRLANRQGHCENALHCLFCLSHLCRGQGNGATGVHRAFSYGYRGYGSIHSTGYQSNDPTARLLTGLNYWRPQSVLLWIPWGLHRAFSDGTPRRKMDSHHSLVQQQQHQHLHLPKPQENEQQQP